ncbi:uncharacterized protein LOC108670159 [Hyalella azteca]|uniref:Uncharacterized protein LOC108670159 n=1 Tax=Hyalella azteca TaxID=294128 RepID=A0A8B7NHJ3_HYAAZ|nr:uncharacterized protein LOC108670159 [Hyalella azteca]
MLRGFVILIVAAAAASAQDAAPACLMTLNDAANAMTRTARSVCYPQYTADVVKFDNNPNCNIYATSYYATTCDPIVANYMKCTLKAAKLLKVNNTFDEAAFKATTLKNKCSTDAKFIAAYPPCKNSTMKYLHVSRFIFCLMQNTYGE